MELAVSERVLRFRKPLRTASGQLSRRRVFEVTLTGDDGLKGRGEACALQSYDGVSDDAVRAALHAYKPVVERSGTAARNLVEECRAVADLPQALAAIDIARWDLEGQRTGEPIAALLADDPLVEVECNAVADTLDDALAAEKAGFECIKIKVGFPDDAHRVAAFRAALAPQTRLRLDANGAWDPDTAVEMIDRLSGAGLELVEEPVHGVRELRAVRERVAARIAMDETGAVPGALASGATDVVCLKLSRAGGIGALLAQAALVRSTGAEVYVASTFDGPIGIRASLHCAAALRCELPCGLATLSLFEGFALKPPMAAIGDAPGLG